MLSRFSSLFRIDWLGASLIATLALGLAVRTVGVGFDLPMSTHPDEGKVIRAVVDMFARRSFEPHEFTWPAHIVIMAGYFSSTIYSYLVLGMRPEAAITEVGIEHWYLATRIAVAVISTAGIGIAYFIGKTVNRQVGVISAVLIAFFPIFVGHSHYATTDMVLATIVLAVIYAGIRYLNNPRYPALLAMAFLTALAIATKYPGLIAAGMIAIVVGVRAFQDRAPWRFLRHGFVSLFALGLSLFIISPKLFTERAMVIRSVNNESRTEHLGADGLNYVEKLIYYWSAYQGAAGFLLLVPFIVGIIAIIRLKLINTIPLFTGVLFWLSLSALGLHWVRWGMPMYVTPLLVSAIGIYYIIDVVPRLLPRGARTAKGILVGISVIATANLIADSVAISANLTVTDTRKAAAEDFIQRGITPNNSVYEGYTPAASDYPTRVFNDFTEQNGKLVPEEATTQYVVLSSSMYGRYANNPKYAEQQRFYALLEDQYPLVVEYQSSGGLGGSTNPLINIPRKIGTVALIAQGKVTKGPTIRVFAVTPESG